MATCFVSVPLWSENERTGTRHHEGTVLRSMIRVMLPTHLRTLAKVDGEVTLEIEGAATQRSVLDALESRYPVLRGTIREHGTLKRRAFMRFFACEEDLSHESPDALLPEAVASGKEPFMVIGAIAGGSSESNQGYRTTV